MKKIFHAIKEFFILILQCLMIAVLFVYTKIKFRVKLNKNQIDLPKEPAIFLCNHQTNWDPLFMRILIPRRIYFIAHDELFKNKFTAWLFTNLFDTIKRGANKNDIRAVKSLLQLKKEKKNIGVFPEGGIPYWPETLKIEDNIAKLCKKLDMPIVLHHIYGGSFVYPRYVNHKGRIRPVIERKRVISKEELSAMSVEELAEIINECLYVNDFAIQKKRKVAISRKRPAESIESGVFCCPHCHSFNTLISSNNVIKCTSCDFYNVVNKYDLLESPEPKFLYFEDYLQWNTYQIEYLKEYLSKYDNIDTPILTVYSCDVKYGKSTDSYSHIEEQDGSLELFKNHMLITIGLDVYEVPYSEVTFGYVEFRSTLEIKMVNNKIRLSNERVKWSPYQFATTINLLKEINEKNV
ncbi:MAG: lysophospholipid acyltransferase family protein [Christensenellales bacterium]